MTEQINVRPDGPSLYDHLGVVVKRGPRPTPPGTMLTATIETIDNDCSASLLTWVAAS